MNTLKRKATDGLLWSGIDKFSTMFLQFVLGIVLARILVPHDYGLIGMIAVFIAIGQSLVNSGFYAALIQKKDVNDRDHSTIFYFNLITSILLYGILFLSSGYIADFYKEPLLVDLIRIVGLNIIIMSFSLIHRVILTINIDFKTQAIVNITASLLGGVVGIVLAIYGYGVWALVYQLLCKNLTTSLMFWILNHWKPLIVFDSKSFKALFGFGSNLLISELLRIFFRNIYLIIIGKTYNAEELGYFTRAILFKQIPGTLVNSILQSVTFPLLVKVIDNDAKTKDILERSVRLSGFLLSPVTFIFLFYSEPIILVLLTEKWLPSVLLLQILSLEIIFLPVQFVNLNYLNAKGRSDLFLYLEVIKNILTIVVIIATYKLGLVQLVIGYVGVSFLSFFINTYFTKKFIRYSALNQLEDLMPYVFTGLITGGLSFYISNFLSTPLLKLFFGVGTYACFYTLLSYVFKFRELFELREIFLDKLKMRK
jgi:O-antigen/teichoic acid export membrane protein